ncbi:unknown [Clostridium sp. CAG:149]|nr:unknown [Clostridium sp. CAG:149]
MGFAVQLLDPQPGGVEGILKLPVCIAFQSVGIIDGLLLRLQHRVWNQHRRIQSVIGSLRPLHGPRAPVDSSCSVLLCSLPLFLEPDVFCLPGLLGNGTVAVTLLYGVRSVRLPVCRCLAFRSVVRKVMAVFVCSLLPGQVLSFYLMDWIVIILQRIVLLLGNGKALVLIAAASMPVILISNRSRQLIRFQAVLVHLKIPVMAVGADHVLPLVGGVLIPLLPKPDQEISLCGLIVQRLFRVVPVLPVQLLRRPGVTSCLVDAWNLDLPGPVDLVMLICQLLYRLLFHDHVGSVGKIGGQAVVIAFLCLLLFCSSLPVRAYGVRILILPAVCLPVPGNGVQLV